MAGRTGDERVHAIQQDTDTQYNGLVYDDWMMGGPLETSLHILAVN
jgi:hypothetical protein